jgi:hypothetical protein
MARKPRPVDPTAGPLQEFAHDLRALRENAGNPTYRNLARKAGFGATTLGEAAGGVRFPSLDVTLAYVGACDGDVAAWRERWHRVERELSSVAAEKQASDDLEEIPGVSPSPAHPEPTSWRSRRGRWRASWRVRLAAGSALVILAVVVTLISTNPTSRGAAPGKTVSVDQTCPTFAKPGAFDGETYMVQTAVRTAPRTGAHLVKNVPASCRLQFTGYCLGAVVHDHNDIGQALPDSRWFELEGGDLISSAVIHGNPPATMRPNSCPGSVPAPKSIALGVVADPDVPGWAVLSAHGDGLLITGYAAYFAPVDAPGTAPDWHEIGAPTSTSAGFDVPWIFGKAGEAPDSAPILVVAAACLAADAPTTVTDAVQVVPENPATAKPATLSAATLAKAAAAACAIPS